MLKETVMAVALMAGVGTASAATIDFDSTSTGDYITTGSGRTVGDLTFSLLAGAGPLVVWDGTSPNSNGTNNLIFWSEGEPGAAMSITASNGGLFDLHSIDFALSWYVPVSQDSILVNGTRLDLTPTLTTFALNIRSVSSVVISPLTSWHGYWTADNIVYDLQETAAPVPVPAAGLLLLGGLGAFGGLSWRRKQKAAAA